MLSAWMRMMYGSIVAGSIASSAPIWGFPKTLLGLNYGYDDGTIMDSAAYVVGRALLTNLSGNSTTTSTSAILSNNHVDDDDVRSEEKDNNYCFKNLLATWPLLQFYGKTVKGREFLTKEFRLCTPLNDENDVMSLLEWAQSPWFDLAEGDFPYPSSYIPYALGEGLHELPAWPLQEACHGSSGLNTDFGITFYGSPEDVDFEIHYGEDAVDPLILKVDWDIVQEKSNSKNDNNIMKAAIVASDLFASVREAVSIWFNVTKALDCFEVIPAINHDDEVQKNYDSFLGMINLQKKIKRRDNMITGNEKHVCQQKLDNETVWSSLVCNDNINLIMTYARGMGRDFFWPPSHPRDQKKYEDTIKDTHEVEKMYTLMCQDSDGIYGYPDKSKVDPYSTFLDDIFR